MRFTLLPLALLATFSISAAAYADPVNLVTNGNFAGGTYNSMPGWSNSISYAGGNDTEFGKGDATWDEPATLPAGYTTFAYLQDSGDYYGSKIPGDNTASTLLTSSLIANDTYDFSFYYDARHDYSQPVGTFTAFVGDQTLFSATQVSSTAQFILVNGSFVADGSSSRLSFENSSTRDASIDLTGVSLSLAPAVVAATPEPSSLMLLGTGIVGVAGAARRRFRKA